MKKTVQSPLYQDTPGRPASVQTKSYTGVAFADQRRATVAHDSLAAATQQHDGPQHTIEQAIHSSPRMAAQQHQIQRLSKPAALRHSGADTLQRKMDFRAGTDYLNIDGEGAGIANKGYHDTLRQAIDMDREIIVQQGEPRVGTAMYTPDHAMPSGQITVKPIGKDDIRDKTEAYNSRLIAMAHETRHGIDDLTKTVKFRNSVEQRIHTEWRAFATQSAVAWQMAEEGKPVEERYRLDVASYASEAAFTSPASRMVETTQSYMRLYKLNSDPSVADVRGFMRAHNDWVTEAVALHHALRPREISVEAAHRLRPSSAGEQEWSDLISKIGATVGMVAVAVVAMYLAYYYKLSK